MALPPFGSLGQGSEPAPLSDPLIHGGEQEEILKQAVHEARKRQEAAEAAATPEERVALFAARKDKAKQLSHQQACLRLPHCLDDMHFSRV